MGAEFDDDYAVLGLEPGADLGAVERAYRREIKAHHPDRQGGNPERAAEINRAYRQLRQLMTRRDDVSMRHFVYKQGPGWSRTIWAGIVITLLCTAAAALSLLTPQGAAQLAGLDKPAQRVLSNIQVMEQPLAVVLIDAATRDAVLMSRSSDEMAMTAWSNDCYRQLRETPAIDQFDRCTAFDNAVATLQDRDPLRDRGKFSDIAVTSRLWSAAAPLSSDYLATDSRIRRIRLRVELALNPVDPNSVGP